jgi:hypothetical protein
MVFNAAFISKKDPIYPATIALNIFYYSQELLSVCVYNCGSQSYCGSGSTYTSSCQRTGYAYRWCTNGYLSLTILCLVYILILSYYSDFPCICSTTDGTGT